MDTLTASSVPSRPWVLQFFRNLFGGSRHVVREKERPKAKEAQGKEEVGSQLLGCPLGLSDTEAMLPTDQELGATETSPIEIQESVIERRNEELSLLKGCSFRKATPRNKKKLCNLLNAREMEMGGSHGFTGTKISLLVEHPCEAVLAPGEKKNEPGDRQKDEVSQVLQADDGVSMIMETMANVKDCSAEEEKEHLLKEDVQTEPPKAELSPWNRLINMYKQRRRLPASKVSHLQDISAQSIIEGETTLDLMVYGIAATKAHVTLSKPCGAGSAYGILENEARENAGDCEITQRNLGLNDAESLEHPKNVY